MFHSGPLAFSRRFVSRKLKRRRALRWSLRLLGSAILLLLGLTSAAVAVPIDHGNFAGDSVGFGAVTESGFGTPAVRADRLEFFPSVFGASGVGGAGESNLATLSLAVDAASGFGIRSIGFSERGSYNLQGIGTAATLARVTGMVSGEIIALDSGPLLSPIQFSGDFDITSVSGAGGDFNLVDHLGLAVIWSGALEIDIEALVQAAGFAAPATIVNVHLDNLFSIQSETGSISMIARNEFFIQVGTAEASPPGVIPEPSSWILMAAGILALVTAGCRPRRLRANDGRGE